MVYQISDIRKQGLALLLSLLQTPQLKGHSLEVRAPLGQSTIWRPLQEVRVLPDVPTGMLDIKAVKGMLLLCIAEATAAGDSFE